ncbi:conserved hypothetical protein [Candidatus Terasakiella magnetica]|nr:conserved hypothetical protein [Candidatus Terasakiella magnetica]
MKKVISAQQVLSARTSDTGESVRVVLLDESGEETVVMLPLDQLGILASWLETAGRMAEAEGAGAGAAKGPTAPVMQVDRWTVRPEADDESVVLGFRLANGGEINLRMHRGGTGTFVRSLNSLLGRMMPASPTKTRH